MFDSEHVGSGELLVFAVAFLLVKLLAKMVRN